MWLPRTLRPTRASLQLNPRIRNLQVQGTPCRHNKSQEGIHICVTIPNDLDDAVRIQLYIKLEIIDMDERDSCAAPHVANGKERCVPFVIVLTFSSVCVRLWISSVQALPGPKYTKSVHQIARPQVVAQSLHKYWRYDSKPVIDVSCKHMTTVARENLNWS